jgi:hypothetical protein
MTSQLYLLVMVLLSCFLWEYELIYAIDPMPRMQSFDKENAFSQSGSNNYNYNPLPSNPTPYYSNPPTNPQPSNPIPITSTKGFATPVHTSGGPPLSASPGSGSDAKQQKVFFF